VGSEAKSGDGQPGREPGPTHLGYRDVAALLMLAGYRGTAQEGVRSVVRRLGTDYARLVAAHLLGWSEVLADVPPALGDRARSDATWFQVRAEAQGATPVPGQGPRRPGRRTGR
jgi:hypothetical protein